MRGGDKRGPRMGPQGPRVVPAYLNIIRRCSWQSSVRWFGFVWFIQEWWWQVCGSFLSHLNRTHKVNRLTKIVVAESGAQFFEFSLRWRYWCYSLQSLVSPSWF